MGNIENVLKENKICITTTQGDSMQPMLVEGRDRVVIAAPDFPLKRYDIPVYRRGNHYTMHRIVKVTKKGYVICGDNRARLERDITDNDIIGILVGFYQGERYISCDDEEYLRYVKKVCRRLPLRVFVHNINRAVRKIRRIIKR